MEIRSEMAGDAESIRWLVTIAFDVAPHSSGTEAQIIDGLREFSALTVSLVAIEKSEVVGYVAFSPVTVAGQSDRWFGLGPVAVRPDLQRCGIGTALITKGLGMLKLQNAAGCVVLGDPDYYRNFGFRVDPEIRYPDAPAEYFQVRVISGSKLVGVVAYHEAFGA